MSNSRVGDADRICDLWRASSLQTTETLFRVSHKRSLGGYVGGTDGAQ